MLVARHERVDVSSALELIVGDVSIVHTGVVSVLSLHSNVTDLWHGSFDVVNFEHVSSLNVLVLSLDGS